jgi:hypothetical protein
MPPEMMTNVWPRPMSRIGVIATSTFMMFRSER